MSRIATKPSALLTWSPSRTRLQKRQSSLLIAEASRLQGFDRSFQTAARAEPARPESGIAGEVSCGENPFVRDGGAAHTHKLPKRRFLPDQPRRVVVPVASSGPIDEHDVISIELPAPARQTRLMRNDTEPCAALLFHRRRNRVRLGRHRPGAGRGG